MAVRSDNSLASDGDGGRLQSSRYPTQLRLIAGIRRGEEAAMRELFILYAPLLRDQARKMSVPAAECDQLVMTLLDDVVLHLVEVELPPRELARYLVSSLRNRARNRHRDENRHQSTNETAYSEFGDAAQKIVAECHSQYALEAALPADEERRSPLRSAIAKLAAKSAGELSQEEIIMIVGVGRHIPLRDLAEQLGMTYGAARVRLSRLRERFLKLAIQYVGSLASTEKREIERFFRRADIRLETMVGREEPTESGSTPQRDTSPRERNNDQI